jgi:flagellar export protein FliJ
MKRFVFTLDALYRYKEVLKKKQTADFKKAQDFLKSLLREKAALEDAFAAAELSLRAVFAKGENTIYMLERHDDYFKYLRENKKILALKIERAEKKEEDCRKALAATVKEIKTLENLKEEQFLRYLEEERASDAKEMDDIISFKTIAGGS